MKLYVAALTALTFVVSGGAALWLATADSGDSGLATVPFHKGNERGDGPSPENAGEVVLGRPVIPAPREVFQRPSVIGLIDSGINPYHEAFRRDDWTAHPSTFIPGYPQEARPLELTLDAASYAEAFDNDADLWDSVDAGTLYYVPGTVIVGLYSSSERTLYDEDGHGTMVAGAAVRSSRTAGWEPGLVMVDDHTAHAARWLEAQKWVDIVSLSRAPGVPFPGSPRIDLITGVEIYSPLNPLVNMSQEGRAVFVGAGNDIVQAPATYVNMYTPPQVFSVGMLEQNGNVSRLATRGYDLVSLGWDYLPTHESLDGYEWVGGTSFSTPRMAGFGTALLADVRAAWNDSLGWQDGAWAVAGPDAVNPSAGPLADGRLEARELLGLLRQAARPMMPVAALDEAQVRFLYHGYGVFDEVSVDVVRQALGGFTLPSRPWDDYWFNATRHVAARYWAPWICRENVDVTGWTSCPTGLEAVEALVEVVMAVPPP